MYPSKDARELAILLRISRELDIVGDVSATVDNPSELIAWANILTEPEILAWRARDSGHRYIQVSARRQRAPVRGCITAVLGSDQHLSFWKALALDHLTVGGFQPLTLSQLSDAWSAMPITTSDLQIAEPPAS
ncbi:MAG: hypothetical protein ACJ72O_03900 [Marmoricola sp.]